MDQFIESNQRKELKFAWDMSRRRADKAAQAINSLIISKDQRFFHSSQAENGSRMKALEGFAKLSKFAVGKVVSK
jgi:hypothetical protein